MNGISVYYVTKKFYSHQGVETNTSGAPHGDLEGPKEAKFQKNGKIKLPQLS